MANAVLEQPVRMRRDSLEVTPDVTCVQHPIVNLYMVGPHRAPDRGWVLVDAGLPLFGGRIERAAAERFGPNARPSAIILTHGHFDHVGALPELAERWDVPVYAHELEMPYLTGQSSYPPPDPSVGGGMMSFLSRFYPRGPIHLGSRFRLLPADGSVPEMPGWRWLHTPGHTPGHVSLFRDADRTLIAGDAFVTVEQESALAALLQHHQHVHRPPAYYTPDWQAAHQSVLLLAGLRPHVAATGHGPPMYGESMRQQLDELAHAWNRLALPSRGRYVRQPAIMDKRGVVRVPPPVADPQLLVVAGISLVALLGILTRNR